MFASIGQIFQTQPRQAEQSDTRQDIQRHDPEFERRKKKKHHEDEDLFPEDGATVSVQALRVFLENFLKSLSEEQQNIPGPNTQDENQAELDLGLEAPPISKQSHPESQVQHVSGQAAYAANTYQHIASAGQKRSILEQTGVSGVPPIHLDASEVRTIHAILDDLKIAEERNVEYIRIERSESFLGSIAAAVDKIKHGPNFSI